MCLKYVHGPRIGVQLSLKGLGGHHSSLELYGRARELEWTELVPGKRQWSCRGLILTQPAKVKEEGGKS